MKRAFSSIDVPSRPSKPRNAGLTMMIDWGLPLGAQTDTTALAAEFVDLAKVAVGISRLLPEQTLTEKLRRYQDAAVEPFPGGMLLEIAHGQGSVAAYYEACQRVGYRLVEVSDNVVSMSPQEKDDLIREAIETYGFRVLGEVGKKRERTDLSAMISDVERCLEAGAWRVFVEAAELTGDRGFDAQRLEALCDAVDPETIIFELPGKWIADVHAHEVHQMMVWLVDHLGPELNIGNVLPEDVVVLETLRARVGVNMSAYGEET